MIRSRFNALYIGFLSGLLLPIVILMCVYFFTKVGGSLSMYLRITFEYSILAKLISLAAIPDALLFFVFIWTDKLKSAKGVIFSLFLMCIIVIIIKLIP
jgi:hypothetical protein